MTYPFGPEGAATRAWWRTGTTLSVAGVIDETNRTEIAERVAAEVVAGVDHLDPIAVTHGPVVARAAAGRWAREE